LKANMKQKGTKAHRHGSTKGKIRVRLWRATLAIALLPPLPPGEGWGEGERKAPHTRRIRLIGTQYEIIQASSTCLSPHNTFPHFIRLSRRRSRPPTLAKTLRRPHPHRHRRHHPRR